MAEKYYITTPIYYASGNLHIGHSYTTLAADALSRYKRLRGCDVLFLTGTDEHGLKIQEKAESASLSPKDFVDGIVAGIKELWQVLHISYDQFIRTTDEHHVKTVQYIMEKLYQNDDIYKKNYESWYCVGCEAFYTETQARSFPDMICPHHGKPLVRVQEESYFFKLSKYQDKLLKYIEEHPDFIQPVSRRNEVLGFIKAGLEDLCITRTSFDWGVKVPFDPESVVYVWVDALANYISAIGYPDDLDRFNRYWPCELHLIGKEILRFHAITWPILLLALDLPLPKKIFAHGWLNLGGKKMSKTMGNVVDPKELVHKYGLDAIRYFVLREVPFGADGDFTEESLIGRINSDLANDLGNLVYRTLTMLKRFTGAKVPEMGPENKEDMDFKKASLGLKNQVEEELENLRINTALEKIMDVVKAANKYIDQVSPWRLSEIKDPRLGTVLYNLCQCIGIVGLLLRPFMVKTPQEIWQSLGLEDQVESLPWDAASSWDVIPVGSAVKRGKPLFPRIDTEHPDVNGGAGKSDEKKDHSETDKDKTEGEQNSQNSQITIEDFRKIDLRVAKVLECQKVPGAQKLLQLKIKIGEEVRQLVAGVAQYYSPEELIDKKIIVVYNLKPAEIRGILSQGMLLAAKDGENLCVVTLDREVKDGGKVS